MKHNEQPRPQKVAYLIKRFPHLSETFILHEVLELERQGLSLRIFSLREPIGKVNQAAEDVRAPITYLPQGFPFGPLGLLKAAFKRFVKNPRSFLGVSVAALIQFHHRSTPRHILYAAYVANQVEAEGITHLHAHYANTPTTVALLVHKFTGITYSFTAHAKDIYLSRKETLAYKMKYARFVVTCTEYNRQYLASVADPQSDVPIHRIYHGLDLRVFPADPHRIPSANGRPLILSVARLVEKKGLPYLLQACRILLDQGYDFDCRIVGEGPFRPVIEQQIRDLDLSTKVNLWGAETHERVIEMYQQATLVVLPCVVANNGDRDGIPNALVESLYMGVPVISTPVSGVPELIHSEVNGLLVPQRDADSLAKAIVRLFDNPRLYERMVEAGQQTVLNEFDMAANVCYLMQLFQNLDREAASVAIPVNLFPENANQTTTFSHIPANPVRLDLKQ